MCSSSVSIFLLPWTSWAQEEREIHTIFVGCGVDREGHESLLNLFMLPWYLLGNCGLLLPYLLLSWGWKGWVVRLRAIDGSDQRLQGGASLLTAPCWVWKEEEEGLSASAKSSHPGSMVGGGVLALSMGRLIFSPGKTEKAPANKE